MLFSPLQAVLSVSAAAAMLTSPSPSLPEEVSLAAWTPAMGDHLIVDTKENMGYLLRLDDSEYVTFPVATGRKEIVNYIGRTYNAATPSWHWIAKSKEIMNDHITFGPTGRFLRLYKNGKTHTSYGIHEVEGEEEMFALAERYKSFGCIIVKRAMLDVIEETYFLNGEYLDVVTVSGFDVTKIRKDQ